MQYRSSRLFDREPSFRLRSGLLLCAAALILAPSCGDSTPKVVAGPSPVGCLAPSDCDDGRICVKKTPNAVGGICHAGCVNTSACSPSERCVSSLTSPVCLLAAETECTYDSDCFVPLVCGPDQRCRDRCQKDYDCIAPQQCTAEHVCAEANEVGPDGKLIIVPLHDPSSTGDAGAGGTTSSGGAMSGGGGSAGRTPPDPNTEGGAAGQSELSGAGGSTPNVGGGSGNAAFDPACSNGKLDGTETSKDCGGPACAKCPAESACVYHSDCASGACEGGTCKPKYTLTVERSQNFTGRVVSTPTGIDCGLRPDVDCSLYHSIPAARPVGL